MTAIAILSLMLADMGQSASTAFAAAETGKDRLRAEYVAKSGISLTRLVISKEPEIRAAIAPFYQMLVSRPPPQIPVWKYAGPILQPFCNYDAAVTSARSAGIDLDSAEGIDDMGGTCTVTALAENSKINLSDPLHHDGDEARKSTAMQLLGLLGGYHSPSPYDPLFDRQDADGQYTSRLDVVSDIIDWWDYDTERTVFDPGAATVTSAGGEDDVYQSFRDPYRVKNAPYDSLEELRLIRGVSDDFWATFIQPDPEDPEKDLVTIYGSGAVNPNEAPPEVMLARVCSYLSDQPLCTDPAEAAKFIQIVSTVRSILPIPFFSNSGNFLSFIQGTGGPNELYPMLRNLLGENNPLLFRPVTIPQDKLVEVDNAFVTAARIITIQSVGEVGRARVRIRAVINTHDRWTPPPPNAGGMPPLGVFHYWRQD